MLDHPYRDFGIAAVRTARRKAYTITFIGTPLDQGDAIGLEAFLAIDHFDPDPLAGTERINAAAA